ncbi:MAG: hypothetical protein COZ38_10990 [Rhodocyclales bacterium CG_4_10_14_3_um_filter_68_10]|nr:MAG: hypothetical protein COZ38_10990 [Rhodocyclales bacterium CG_4_10_14_3_um_filter_68_10]
MILALLATGPFPVGTGNPGEAGHPLRDTAGPHGCARACGSTGHDGAIPDCQTAGFQRRLDLAMRFPKLEVILFEGETRVCAAKMELIRRYAARPGQARPALCGEHFGACTRICQH